MHMRTTLDLPEDLLRQAIRVSKEKTKTATIVTALREYIRLSKLKKLARSTGSVRFDSQYDWSKARHGR